MTPFLKHRLIPLVLATATLVTGSYAWTHWHLGQLDTAGLVSGNGRTEATEIDIAAKLGGRVQDIAVKEGELVHAGETLAQMQVGQACKSRWTRLAPACSRPSRPSPAPKWRCAKANSAPLKHW